LVFKQALRQSEGLLKSIIELLKLDLAVPDHTTLSRRARRIVLSKISKSSKEGLVVMVDSTGLKVVGEKEWMNHKQWHKTKESLAYSRVGDIQ